MLTADMVRVRRRRGFICPEYIDPGGSEHAELAATLIALFEEHVDRRRYELAEALRDYVGSGTEYLLHRGLAKLLFDRCEFETATPVEPELLRQAVFEATADRYQEPHQPGKPWAFDREEVLAAAVEDLEIEPDQVDESLYADLKDCQRLARFKGAKPEWLLHRYNVALAQAVLYKATDLTVQITGQSPARYRQLFRFMKFYRLMHHVEGSVAKGYRVQIDGPVSLFRSSQKYGIQMAQFLPALVRLLYLLRDLDQFFDHLGGLDRPVSVPVDRLLQHLGERSRLDHVLATPLPDLAG